jgi:hypothetical protein
VCRHYVLADGTGCADEDVCNGTEVCHLGICTAGTPLDCDDHDPCTADTCDPKTGCAHDVLADGTTCGSNLYCHAGVCGACTPGASCALTPPRVCHVGVVSCATGVAVCTDKNAPSATLCDDGDPCTANDLCDGQGTCAGVPYSCAPPTECQQSSSCDGTGGCAIVNAIAGTVCAGADYCSGDYRHYNWKCDGAGSCRAASTQPCPAASDCQTGGCVDGACLQVVSRAPGTPCAGANACEAYACDGTGSCADLGAVSDGTACPSGICCGGACLD